MLGTRRAFFFGNSPVYSLLETGDGMYVIYSREGWLTFDHVDFVDPVTGRFWKTHVETGPSIPHWLLVLLFAAAPAAVYLLRTRRHRFKAGVCSQCGYDLRATPDRYPECGALTSPETI